MAPKLYTVAEANALLPHVAPALVELRDKFGEARAIRAAMAAASRDNGWSAKREEWRKTLARVAELLERIDAWGLVLRDLATGLIDFPAVVEGRDAFLCWRLGEPEVAYWHATDEGFRARKPI